MVPYQRVNRIDGLYRRFDDASHAEFLHPGAGHAKSACCRVTLGESLGGLASEGCSGTAGAEKRVSAALRVLAIRLALIRAGQPPLRRRQATAARH